jgi:hypothetical protein
VDNRGERVGAGTYRGRVRWDALFDDLEAQLAREQAAELAAVVAERCRAGWASTSLADRLRAHVGAPVRLLLDGGHRVSGTCTDAAVEWLAVDEGVCAALVPVAAVAAVSGLGRPVAEPAGQVLRRLGLGHALRALARDRAGVRLVTSAGELAGTIDRVGADHLDLAEHSAGEARRPDAVRAVQAVPFSALRVVRSR